MMENFEHNGYGYSLEKSRLSDNYRNIILLGTVGVNLSQMDEDSFVDYLAGMLKTATDKYRHLVKEELAQYWVNRRTDIVKNAERVAERKWKTEKKRKEYIDRVAADFDAQSHNYPNDNIFFDFWPGPHHGLPGVCSGLHGNTSVEQLHTAWKNLHENEWFNKGLGLVFKYETTDDSYMHHFRPWIEVVMTEEDKAAADAAQKAIDDDIANFYKGCRYCGD